MVETESRLCYTYAGNTGKALCMEKNESFPEKLKSALKDLWARICAFFTSLFSAEHHNDELLVPRSKDRSFILETFFSTIKVMLLLLVLGGVAVFGLVMGVAKAYIDTTPELDISQLTRSARTSFIYDRNGNLITTFAGMEYRDWADIEEIPDMLKNAVISVEDVRFYKHGGVDYKRLFSAVINTLRNADTHGGSTITQQLIKNKILSNEQSYKRKIQEAYLSLEVETILSKDDILEAYLNNVFLGDSNYGVKTAAKDYFGKELKELSIRECAMLAGMVQKPYETDPRANTYKRSYADGRNKMDITDTRTNVVIECMYEAGFITLEQKEQALGEQVYILEKSEKKQLYDMPYFVEYAIYDVITHILSDREMLDTKANRAAIENELRTGGYGIYLTVDTDMQHIVEDTLMNWDEYPSLADPSAAVKIKSNADGTTLEVRQPQAAAVIIDQHNGELLAVVGGRDMPTRRKQWNLAYQSAMEVGSSIKPLAVYGPALDMGEAPASIIHNLPSPIVGWNTETGFPNIGDEKYIGPITVRRGLVSSLNVAAARLLMYKVTPSVSAKYLEALGVDPSRINADGSGLALGTSGITPIEMAGAYGAIANEGTYIEPISFIRVVDDNGKTVLRGSESQKTRQVFRPSSAYMLVDMMTNAVKSGTGTKAKIDNITVAGKTGTNSDYRSVYFAGITPYCTAVVWVGHEDYSQKLKNGSTGGKYAAPLWQSFMSRILEGYIDKPIIDESPVSLGLVKRTVCSVSGKLATEACYQDPNGHVPVTDWFEQTNVPQESCDMHIMSNICTQSGQIATSYCPQEYVQSACMLLIDADSPYREFPKEILSQYMSNLLYTDYTYEQYLQMSYAADTLCAIHTPYGYTATQWQSEAATSARQLVSDVEAYLLTVQTLSETERNMLQTALSQLKGAIEAGNSGEIAQAMERLKYNYTVMVQSNPPVATGNNDSYGQDYGQ